MSKVNDIQFQSSPMNDFAKIGISLLMVGMLLSSAAQAQVAGAPAALMAYQGYIADAAGNPLGVPEANDYSVQFSLYTTAEGGEPIWGEEQTVAVSQGYFTVLLGEGTPLVSPAIPLPSAFAQISGDGAFLQMAVRSTPEQPHQPLMPRLRIGFAPYAIMSQLAGELVNESGAAQVTSDGINAVVSNLAVSNSVTALSGVSGTAGSGLTGLNANAVDRGTLNAARMPSIPVSQFTSGRFSEDRLPGLNASVFKSGLLRQDSIPLIPASKITSGTFSVDRLPSLRANNFTGVLNEDVIPSISTDRLQSVFPVSRGGSGRSFITSGTLLRTDGSNPLVYSSDLYYGGESTVRGLRAASGGPGQTDWPSGWGGGIQTYDVVLAGVRYVGWSNRSDERLKQSIEPLSPGSGLPLLTALRPVAFNWLDPRLDEGRFVYGFIAQEVEEVMPEMISRSLDDEGILAIRDDQFFSWLVLGVQEQQQLLMENQARGLQFDDRVTQIRNRILALDREVNRHD
jgi:hypothetical protein